MGNQLSPPPPPPQLPPSDFYKAEIVGMISVETFESVIDCISTKIQSKEENKKKIKDELEKIFAQGLTNYEMLTSLMISYKLLNAMPGPGKGLDIQDGDTIILEKEIAKGSYGKIYLSNLEEKAKDSEDIIYKQRIKNDDKATDDENKQAFIEECITSILLWCLYDEMKRIYIDPNPNPFDFIAQQIENPFAKIFGLYKVNPNPTRTRGTLKRKLESLPLPLPQYEDFILGIEKLELRCDDYLKAKTSQLQSLAICKIARLLYFLQTTIGFVHGDLHSGNIMFKEDRAYVIDFGVICVDLSRCGLNKQFHDTKTAVYDNINRCKNPSQDLRLLLASLYYSDVLVGDCKIYIASLFTKYVLDPAIKYPQHNFYTLTENNFDINFTPLSIVDRLQPLC